MTKSLKKWARKRSTRQVLWYIRQGIKSSPSVFVLTSTASGIASRPYLRIKSLFVTMASHLLGSIPLPKLRGLSELDALFQSTGQFPLVPQKHKKIRLHPGCEAVRLDLKVSPSTEAQQLSQAYRLRNV